MSPFRRAVLIIAALLPASLGAAPAAPMPGLTYAFTARVEVAAPIEQGTINGGRERFIPITGGTVTGPLLTGTVLAGGGDWQTILPAGLARIEARYFIKADDGTVIAVTNPGVRTASAEVTEQLARGDAVDPGAYYFRSAPRFVAAGERYGWMQRAVFVARGIRRPDHVLLDVYRVD